MRLLSTLSLLIALPLTIAAQGAGPGLVVAVPSTGKVTITKDSFATPTGERRAVEVFRPRGHASRTLPVVIFVNGSGPALMQARGYQDWARLVTTRHFAAVLYEGPSYDQQKSFEENTRTSVAQLDSVVTTLERRRLALGIDPSTLVIWAGSAQTWTGTPYSLSGNRPVNGYILYYGAGVVPQPRIDVPVFAVRAGLDSPGLNAQLDSLTRRLTEAGSPLTVVSYPAGTHGFDLNDSTATTAQVIAQTLDFMQQVTTPAVRAATLDGVPEIRAAVAMAAQRWADAERMYLEVAQKKPTSRIVAWKLGLAQLGNGHPADALGSFDRAKALGQGGARDLGLPAMRAAVRAGNQARAGEWAAWALQSFPRIRDEIAADRELAPLLATPKAP